LGIGPNPQSPIPNPQSPIPNNKVTALNIILNKLKILIILIKNSFKDFYLLKENEIIYFFNFYD